MARSETVSVQHQQPYVPALEQVEVGKSNQVPQHFEFSDADVLLNKNSRQNDNQL